MKIRFPDLISKQQDIVLMPLEATHLVVYDIVLSS